MKKIIIGISIFTIFLSACNSNNNGQNNSSSDTTENNTDAKIPANDAATKGTASIQQVVNHYIGLKNALADDNGSEAATHGKALVEAIDKIDTASLPANQRKVFDDAAADAKEMAEHISSNPDKIEHQREHFDMLSKDMYDLVKAFGSGQILYQDFCPMYNDKKGATWLSETKEIKNPYLGNKMPTCGIVKEEIK